MMKSTSLCLSIVSAWKLVMRKEISYPCRLRLSFPNSASAKKGGRAHLNRLSPKNDEILGAHHHESREFVTKNAFDIVLLLDPNRHADRIDRGLDEHLFFLVAGDSEGV